MHVSQLARELGVTSDTVRFYTREGLLHPAKNPVNRYNEYSVQDRNRLRFILSARQLGFSVSDIRQIIGEADKGETPCPVVRTLIELRLHEIERRYKDMAVLRDRIVSAMNEWNTKPDRAPTGHMICHLIEDIAF